MTTEASNKPAARNFNKPAYIVFLAAGIYFMIRKDFSEASTFWGLALIFDPFDINTAFAKRPFYQQAWLIVHLAITFALFAIMIWDK